MADQTFTAGQILTATQMGTLQTNIGLTYITGGALSSTTTNFAGCFTSSFENYRIEFSKISMNTGGYLSFRMLNSTTAFTTAVYHSGLVSTNSQSTTVTVDKVDAATFGIFGYSFQATTDGSMSAASDFMNPFGTGRTFYTGGASSYYAIAPFFSISNGGGGVNSTNSFDGIQILNSNGGTIAGNVRIYGYRNS